MSLGGTPVEILVVCTANRCRSPLAAALLAPLLELRGVPARVATAGLRSPGRATPRETTAVASRRQLDVSAHRSRVLDAEEVATADLILGMERLHVREVVARHPGSWPRTFTLKGLVRRATELQPRAADEMLEAWLARMNENRAPRDLLGASPEDDVTDPTGGTLAEHEDLAEELADLIARLVDLAWPPTVRTRA